MTTLSPFRHIVRARRRQIPLLALLFALLFAITFLAGCDDETKATTGDKCDDALDEGDWDEAIEICSTIETDSGYSRTAQAYMGRAGISLLSLIEKLGDSKLEGLALILGTFAVTPVQALDVDSAIEYLLLIDDVTDTDSFNLIVASDVAIATLLKDSLGITVNEDSGDVEISGITDSGLEDLSGDSDTADIQDVMEAIYEGTYYSTEPPEWEDSNEAALDLKKISSYVQANALGVLAVELGDLDSLDFATPIDNGKCALSSGETASGVDNSNDGKKTVTQFPRRLNTSDTSAVYLADDLSFVLLDSSGAVDADREWDGGFILPSRLLNPDFIGVECGQSPAGVQTGEFSLCIAAGTTQSTDITSVTKADLTTALTCGGTCTAWPLLATDGTPPVDTATDEFLTEGTAARTQLAGALHDLYPVDNEDDSPSSSGLHCDDGDGWVHAREFDYYLRNFGQ